MTQSFNVPIKIASEQLQNQQEKYLPLLQKFNIFRMSRSQYFLPNEDTLNFLHEKILK